MPMSDEATVLAFGPATVDSQSPLRHDSWTIGRSDPTRALGPRALPGLDVQSNFQIDQTLAQINDPCPVLALAEVRPNAHTTTWYRLPPQDGRFFFFRSPTSDAHARPLRALVFLRNRGEGNPNLFFAAANLPPVAQQSLCKEVARPLPSPVAPLFYGPGVVPSISLIRCHELGPHTARRKSILQQQLQKLQPARVYASLSRQTRSSMPSGTHSDSHGRVSPSPSAESGPLLESPMNKTTKYFSGGCLVLTHFQLTCVQMLSPLPPPLSPLFPSPSFHGEKARRKLANGDCASFCAAQSLSSASSKMRTGEVGEGWWEMCGEGNGSGDGGGVEKVEAGMMVGFRV